jgi:hypothetical protein
VAKRRTASEHQRKATENVIILAAHRLCVSRD